MCTPGLLAPLHGPARPGGACHIIVHVRSNIPSLDAAFFVRQERMQSYYRTTPPSSWSSHFWGSPLTRSHAKLVNNASAGRMVGLSDLPLGPYVSIVSFLLGESADDTSLLFRPSVLPFFLSQPRLYLAHRSSFAFSQVTRPFRMQWQELNETLEPAVVRERHPFVEHYIFGTLPSMRHVYKWLQVAARDRSPLMHLDVDSLLLILRFLFGSPGHHTAGFRRAGRALSSDPGIAIHYSTYNLINLFEANPGLYLVLRGTHEIFDPSPVLCPVLIPRRPLPANPYFARNDQRYNVYRNQRIWNPKTLDFEVGRYSPRLHHPSSSRLGAGNTPFASGLEVGASPVEARDVESCVPYPFLMANPDGGDDGLETPSFVPCHSVEELIFASFCNVDLALYLRRGRYEHSPFLALPPSLNFMVIAFLLGNDEMNFIYGSREGVCAIHALFMASPGLYLYLNPHHKAFDFDLHAMKSRSRDVTTPILSPARLTKRHRCGSPA